MREIMSELANADTPTLEAVRRVLLNHGAPAPVVDERLLSKSEVARRLGIGRSTVARLVRSGALSTVHLCEAERVKLSSVLRFLDGEPRMTVPARIQKRAAY